MLLLLYRSGYVVEATGSSNGSGVATGYTSAIYVTVGSSNGVGTVDGLTESVVTTVGSSSGTSTVSGISQSVSTTVASSSGSSTASALVVYVYSSSGSSSGTSSSPGISGADKETVASATGASTVSGVGESVTSGVIESEGNASGTSTVIGVSDYTSPTQGTGSSGGRQWRGTYKPKPTSTVYDGKLPEWEKDEEDKLTITICESEGIASGSCQVIGYSSQSISRIPFADLSDPLVSPDDSTDIPRIRSRINPNAISGVNPSLDSSFDRRPLGKKLESFPPTRRYQTDPAERELLANLLGLDPLLLEEEVEV